MTRGLALSIGWLTIVAGVVVYLGCVNQAFRELLFYLGIVFGGMAVLLATCTSIAQVCIYLEKGRS